MIGPLLFTLSGNRYVPITSDLSIIEKALLKTIFEQSDEDCKGFLSRTDLKIAMVSLFGYKPSKYEAIQIMSQYGNTMHDGKYALSMAQFVNAMTPKLINMDKDEEIRQIFMALDTQCKGFLTVDDIRKMFSQIAPCIANDCLEAAFREIDQDRDGRVSYRDFEFLMKFDPIT